MSNELNSYLKILFNISKHIYNNSHKPTKVRLLCTSTFYVILMAPVNDRIKKLALDFLKYIANYDAVEEVRKFAIDRLEFPEVKLLIEDLKEK